MREMRSPVYKKRLTVCICAIAVVVLLVAGLVYWRGANTVRVPILMYHHLSETGDPGSTISAEAFESHIEALSGAGYEAVSFEELLDYVNNGAPLPKRPVIITFDDGYMSVYETAFPILKKYNMKATSFIIGILHGESVYKGRDYLPITPHFGDTEAREMAASGIFSIQSHSYDMHHYIPYEAGSPRVGILRKDDESEDEYLEAFIEDYTLSANQIANAVGLRPFAYSYPFGRSTQTAENILKDLGVTVTLTIVAKHNTVVKNSPDSLFSLGRFNVPGDMTAQELLAMIKR